MRTAQLQSLLRSAWQQRSARERLGLGGLAWLLGAALLWQWGLAPALATWRMAEHQQAQLDSQTLQMLQLQAQAQQLKPPQRLPRADAVRHLQTSAEQLLGQQVKLDVQGEQLRLSLLAAPAQGLAQWLRQAREHAQAVPMSAQLQRAEPAAAAPTAPTTPPAPGRTSAEALWRGELTLRLR